MCPLHVSVKRGQMKGDKFFRWDHFLYTSEIVQSLIEWAILMTWVTKQYFGNGDKK